MTLKQLEAFYWAATCASFAIAAERVHLSVSSLSKRISELEVSLGRPLFDRSGRHATLTAEGEELLPRVRELLHASAALRGTGSAAGLQGRCRFGVGDLSAITWLPRFVMEATRRHPRLQLEPRSYTGQELGEQIGRGELDWVVRAEPSTSIDLAAERVGQIDFRWVACPAMVRRSGPTPRELLAGEQLITLPDSAGSTRVLDTWQAANPTPYPQRRLSCNNWASVAGMIVAGVGFGFMPQAWAQALVDRGALAFVGGATELPPLGYAVQWRRDDPRLLISEMRQIVRETIHFGAPPCLG